MIFWDNQIRVKNTFRCLFVCDMCHINIYVDKNDLRRRKSPYCKGCYKKSEQYKLEKQKSLNNRPIIQKICACGKLFKVQNPRKTFCSEKCQNESYYKNKPKRKPAEKQCDCGKSFVPTMKMKVYCSPECPKRETTFNCLGCGLHITERIPDFERSKHLYCFDCFSKSPEKSASMTMNAKNRRSYAGEENPNFKGFVKKMCVCGNNFEVTPARKNTAKYCSLECKNKYSVSISKCVEYKGIKMRSSWEISYAQYLDIKGYIWKYEPESFKMLHGFYTPDFWVEELNSYVEVKGYFRDQISRDKFEEFSKSYPVILADKEYLLSLGFIRIKSGPQKNQLLWP